MADVELGIRVAESGTERAIANLENLQKRGLSTGAAFDRVANSATAMGNAIDRAVNKAGSGASLSGVDKAAASATSALTALENEYRRLAQAQTNQTAAQRVANNLGSNPQKALNQIATLRAAYNADPIRDAMLAEQEEQAVLSARNGKLSATAALNEAVWGTYAGQLSEADLALDKLTQAEIRYAQAQKQTASAVGAATGNRVAAGLPGAGSFRAATPAEQEAVNAALRNQATALREVTAAQDQLAAAEGRQAAAARSASSAQNDDSQFGYFKYLIIAGAADRAAQAILGIGEAAISAASDQQRSFADVDRTFDGTDSQLQHLRGTLTDLSTVDPINFVDLAQIAALGNQLGVAADNIEQFTTTIAQYSTISGETAETSATAFGKIANLTALPASQFNNLGSAIEYVARTTAATESSISSTSKEIAALASGAGFSAQAIVGLSGALSSLSIPPERARGALSLYFGALNSAIASGGPKLAAFSQITGIAKDQLTQLVANNQGQQVFTAFLNGLQDLNSVAKTTALKEVGLSTIRVDQTMRALAQNVPLVTSSFEGANTAFQANTELARQYATIQNTLASRFVEFQNAVQNAAAAFGGAFAPALGGALVAITNLLVGIEQFVKTPLGQVMSVIAGATGLVVVALLGLVGAFALVTAAQKVVPWALTSLGAGEASSSLVQFLGGLLGVNVGLVQTDAGLNVTAGSFQKLSASAYATKVELLGLPGVMEAVAIGDGALEVGNIAVGDSSVAAAAGLRTMKFALASTGIGLAVVLIGTLVTSMLEAQKATKDLKQQTVDYFGGALPDLTSAFQKDQQTYNTTGKAIDQIGVSFKTSSKDAANWVDTLQNATGAQISLGDGTETTTNKIQKQTIAYGDNAKAALATALANNSKFQAIFKQNSSNNALRNIGFDPTQFAQQLLGDPKEGGKKYVDNLNDSIIAQTKLSQAQVTKAINSANAGKAINNVARDAGINRAQSEDALKFLIQIAPAYKRVADAASYTSSAIAENASKSAALSAAQQGLGLTLTGTSDGFQGATSSLDDYATAVQSGLGAFTDFSTILSDVATKLKLTDSTKETASQFGAGLKDANAKAETFYNNISALASSGATSFATQLAALGPAASNIVATAMNLTPEARSKLESDARLAAFLASDAFKSALQSSMENDNEAYARIFQKTGNLQDVKNLITAQTQPDGGVAALQYERQWDAAHPELPLNLLIKNPTDADLSVIQQQLNGRLTVTANVVPVFGSPDKHGDPRQIGTQGTNTFTDNNTGSTITLPAKLDGKALSDSLTYWEAHENATPKQIAAALNSGTLSSSINDWVKSHGPINITANVNPVLNQGAANALAAKLARIDRAATNARGGLLNASGQGHPAFAAGGGYGTFQGQGTGTSDSLWARVSRGEFINTADSVNYWGADVFESLNRKMLPASFAGMLGAVAAGGNRGPQSVTNVSLVQHNPVTRDPLAQLREDSANLAVGIWGSGVVGS